MKKLIFRFLRLMVGLAVFSIGEYCTLQAAIGLSPWSCLAQGATNHLPWTYGVVHVGISLAIVIIDILLGEQIGFGTLINAVEIGLCVDVWASIHLLPRMESLLTGIPLMIIGLFIMAFGQFLYMREGLGCGPRDALLVGIGRRLPKLDIGTVNIGVLLLALLGGVLLGGPVGIGTVLSAFGIGIAMRIVFRALHFEPRDVVHENMLATAKSLRNIE